MVILLPLLGHGHTGPDPAARYDAFMKAHPTFVATLDVTSGGTVAKTTLRVARAARRLRFDAKADSLDYSVSSVETGYVELDRVSRKYDQRPSIGGFRVYESRFSSAPGLMPGFLLSAKTTAVLGIGKPKVTAVAGGDELHSTVTTQNGPLELRLVVDPQGKPVRFSRVGVGGSTAWRLTSFADVAPTLAPFQVVPTAGYVPYALPDLPTPLAIGETVPLTGWRQDGKAVDLGAIQRGKPRLLAVLGDDSPPSRAAEPFLKDLGKNLPVFVIGPGGITDPSGTRLRRLSPPGAPMFYLVGADGKVLKLWFGFEAAKGAAWEGEVRAAAQGKAAS